MLEDIFELRRDGRFGKRGGGGRGRRRVEGEHDWEEGRHLRERREEMVSHMERKRRVEENGKAGRGTNVFCESLHL